MISLSVDADIAADENLLGKVVADLQEDVEVDPYAGKITGTLHYVTGYTGWSGDVSEQSGNYLALHHETIPDADSITVEVLNGTVGHPVTLDSDGLCVYRITNKDTQKIRVIAWKDGVPAIQQTYDLSELELEGA